MDISQALDAREQLVDSSTPIVETATVTSTPDVDLFCMVNSTGIAEKVRVPLTMSIAIGDTVLLLRGTSKKCWVIAKLNGSRRLPNFGVVGTVVGGSNTIPVTPSGMAVMNLPFLSSYAPANGDTVRITWEPNGGAYVPGKLGTTPPAPPSGTPGIVVTPPSGGSTSSGITDFAARDSGSWRNGAWRTDSGDVVQYDWGGYGENFGSWFYGTAIKDALNGVTVTRFQIIVRRKSGGVWGPQTLHFRLHGSQNRPGGNVDYYDAGASNHDIDINQQAWFDLPISWGQYLVNNGGGISIQGAPYVVLVGTNNMAESGLLRINWSRY